MQRRALLVALVTASAVLAFGVGATALDDALASPDPVPDGGGDDTGSGVDSNSGPAAGSESTGPCPGCGGASITVAIAELLPRIPGSVALGLAAVGTLVLLALWYRAGAGSGASPADRERREDGVDTASDRSGGTRAAVDEPPANNPVYRAWHETVRRIDERDETTTTPGEYARAARERGWDGDAVATLTALFDRVRYGGAAVTEERAARAREAADRLPEEDSS